MVSLFVFIVGPLSPQLIYYSPLLLLKKHFIDNSIVYTFSGW